MYPVSYSSHVSTGTVLFFLLSVNIGLPGGVKWPGDPPECLPRLQESQKLVPALLKTPLHDKGNTLLATIVLFFLF